MRLPINSLLDVLGAAAAASPKEPFGTSGFAPLTSYFAILSLRDPLGIRGVCALEGLEDGLGALRRASLSLREVVPVFWGGALRA